MSEFQRLYGSEEQCEAALEKARWPVGFRCPRCGGHEHGLVYGRRFKPYQCRTCRYQATLVAGTIMQATQQPGFCGAVAAAHHLVSGFLSNRAGQNWHLFARAEPPSRRELRHGLAAA
jgi:hypothetical protein